MEGIFTAEAIIGLITLAVLEIVLGIDNIIFISILAGKLPQEQQGRARTIGLALAMITRILLLLSISWIIRLEDPLFRLPLPFLGEEGREISGRDLILFGGGLFLVGKATYEIHEKLEAEPGHSEVRIPPSFTAVIVQILLLDIVFSLDSVITAVGMVDQIWVMIAAVIIAVGVMLFSADAISEFVNRHPTVKMLALAFLILIGVNLMAEGAGQHIPKGYIYFAMAFSVFVELLNMRLRAKTTGQHPVELRAGYTGQTTPAPARAVAQPQAERSH